MGRYRKWKLSETGLDHNIWKILIRNKLEKQMKNNTDAP